MKIPSLLLIAILLFPILVPDSLWALGKGSKLMIPQIQYRGGDYKPRPRGVESLLAQLAKRTSVEVKRAELDLRVRDPRLYHHPFIYLGGNAGFDPFSKEELQALRNYLNYGGFLLIDDNSSKVNSDFDVSVRKLIADLFPRIPLQKISRDHSIFRSFYLINRVAGRVVIRPNLEGITAKGRTLLVYCANDLAGAWSKNKLGQWDFDMVGGGSRQRKMSLRLGVNIVLYALTLDYKKDMVHLPIILERLRRYNPR